VLAMGTPGVVADFVDVAVVCCALLLDVVCLLKTRFVLPVRIYSK